MYSLEYRNLNDTGRRLAVQRQGGTDDPPETNRPMVAGTWYQVTVLSPLPPEIGSQLTMVLDPISDALEPVVRHSTTVMSVVGTL